MCHHIYFTRKSYLVFALFYADIIPYFSSYHYVAFLLLSLQVYEQNSLQFLLLVFLSAITIYISHIYHNLSVIPSPMFLFLFFLFLFSQYFCWFFCNYICSIIFRFFLHLHVRFQCRYLTRKLEIFFALIRRFYNSFFIIFLMQ